MFINRVLSIISEHILHEFYAIKIQMKMKSDSKVYVHIVFTHLTTLIRTIMTRNVQKKK
jgi:hypothetical protein